MEPEPAHHTLVRLSATDDTVRVRAGERELLGGPTVAGAGGDGWRGEELLVAAAGVSLAGDYHARARREGLATGAFRCVAEGVFYAVHADGGEAVRLRRLVLRVELEAAPEDLARAEHLLHRAKESCVVAAALRVPLELQVTPLPSGALSTPPEPR